MDAIRSAPKSLDSSYPLSCPPSDGEIREISQDLLRILDLHGEVLVMHVSASAALQAERYFRRRWWSGAEDTFRDAVHVCKHRVHIQPGRTAAVTEAWTRMKGRVHSSSWRNLIRALGAGRTCEEICYLQCLFRAAQQHWTRAARWEAAFGSEPNPFFVITQLFERRCWPLGWSDGKLYVSCLVQNERTAGNVFFPDVRPVPTNPQRPVVFLSALFCEPSVRRISAAISARGWTVVHERLDEIHPAEQQLGKRIMEATAVVGIVSPDPDFDLPWWCFQELDFAEACDRPIALLGAAPITMQTDVQSFAIHDTTIEEGFWGWLKCKM
jgi:hypothetical protein